jgi:hypothetical protein
MKKALTSVAAVAVATVATGGVLVGLAAGPAFAAGNPPWEPDANSVGSLAFYDASGNQVIGGNINNTPIAAFVEGSATPRAGDTKATLFGYTPVNGQVPGQWSGEALSGSTTYPNASAPGSLGTSTLPVVTGSSGDESLATYIADFPNSDTSTTDGYGGIYQLRLKTSTTGKTVTTTYDSVDIQVTGNTWSVVYPAPVTTPTTTSLSTTPSSPQVAGTSVQLNASVSPAVSGTVQFEDGTTNIGSPVTVSSGTASISTSTLSVGSHALHAVFTPAAGLAYSGSTGDATFVVTAPPAAGTNTGLSVNPTEAVAFTPVSLTATVSKSSDSSSLGSGDGTVKFYDNGSSLLGSAAVGSGGVAALSYSAFGTGTHSITAQFVPADSTVYATSTSTAVPFTADAPSATPDAQSVKVAIPAGTLTITSPYTPQNPFDLGTAVLDPADSRFTATAPFGDPTTPGDLNGGVTVTDTRAGDLPWTASATVTDFTDGSSDAINGENLAFTNIQAIQIPGNALDASTIGVTDVPSTPGSGLPYSTTDGGSDGLKGGPHQFANAPNGFGEVNLDGRLTLSAPTSTPSGEYTATLTFTVA